MRKEPWEGGGIFRNGIERIVTLGAVLVSQDEEVFLRNLNSFPYLFEDQMVKKRLIDISKTWKVKIRRLTSRIQSWEQTLYLVHLCPGLLDQCEFTWLRKKFYTILSLRARSSENDKNYWGALDCIRRDLTPAKTRVPDDRQIIVKKYEEYRNTWIKERILKTCEDLLKIFCSEGADKDRKVGELSKRMKIKRGIVQRELRRLSEVYEKEIKDKEYLVMLPYLLQDDLAFCEEEHTEKGKEFWDRVWKSISRETNCLKPLFMKKVGKDMKLTKEAIAKILEQVYRKIPEYV